MNIFWSDRVQTPLELYASRELRFRPDNRDIWLPMLHVAPGMDVLEVGCAGGLLLHRIAQCVSAVRLTGIDRDERHIAFAKSKTQELGLDCAFEVADALALPFEENSFDLTLSHTVIEHVPTQPFMLEQYRVLRPGGRIVVLSVRKRYCMSDENWMPEGEEERALMRKLWADIPNEMEAGTIAAYEMPESEFPRQLELAGFTQVDVQMMTLMSYAPDNASVPEELAMQQMEEIRFGSLESMNKALRMNPQGLSEPEQARFRELIDERCDERIRRYRAGEKLWDLATSAVLVVSGIK